MKRFLSFLDQYLSNLSRVQVMAWILGLIAILGIMDYVTGYEITFSFLYLIPILLATWFIGLRAGVVIAVMDIAIWIAVNWLAGEDFSNEVIRFWNAAIRLVFFVFVIYMLDYLKSVVEKATILARTDSLTGVLNSREFRRVAEVEKLRAERYKHSLTVAYIDLDNFKQVNDQYGHAAGDELLCMVATTIMNHIRRTDVVARLGGDEFGLLMPETDQRAAATVIEKIRVALGEEAEKKALKVTFCLGAVSFISPLRSVDEMLRQADKLMYQAKSQGKNREIITGD